MVIESDYQPLLEWMLQRLVVWLVVVGVLIVVGVVFAFLASAIRNGPQRALSNVATGLYDGLVDLLGTSRRRVFALAWLAFTESMQRRVLVAFIVFVVLMLFAGWFLQAEGGYVSFVFTASTWLVLGLVLILSTFSLPGDIQSRTIFTLVSKPVRRNEIVAGRILGFVATGTLLLVLMGAGSYLFVKRGLDHTHRLTEKNLEEVNSGEVLYRGRTTQEQGHYHEVEIYAHPENKKLRTGRTDDSEGHWHEITGYQQDGRWVYEVGPPQGILTAREPQYGTLTFLDRTGHQTDRGISVGKEWGYHSYIEGGSKAAAVWHFENIDQARFGETLPIEFSLRVFRTHKGNIEKGVLGSLVLQNPVTGRKTAPENFMAREFHTDLRRIPEKLTDKDGNPINLWGDIIQDGKLNVIITCVVPGQYYGMARYDLYLRANDRPFALNFFKGYVGIWLMMVLVTTFGVMYSTFLRGSVAMLATMASVVAGFFMDQIYELSTGQIRGGGPAESAWRLVTQRNEVVDLEPGLYLSLVKMFDAVFSTLLIVLHSVLPNLRSLYDASYVAKGFDIPVFTAPGLISHFLTAVAYLLPLYLVAHFSFRAREVAQ